MKAYILLLTLTFGMSLQAEDQLPQTISTEVIEELKRLKKVLSPDSATAQLMKNMNTYILGYVDQYGDRSDKFVEQHWNSTDRDGNYYLREDLAALKRLGIVECENNEGMPKGCKTTEFGRIISFLSHENFDGWGEINWPPEE